MKIERPRGTRDFLPEEMEKRREVEKRFREIVESFGYREVATPTFEYSELFKRKSGEGIVEEMYIFQDKSKREIALRPELTAPVIRMFVNEYSRPPKPIRVYYFGNCFRYERPQKARYREFWQFGVELIGSASYLADAEVIILAYNMLKSLKIDFELNIGHVGILRKLLSPLGERASKAMRLIDKEDKKGLMQFFAEQNVGRDIEEKVYRIMELKGGKEVIKEAKEIVEFDFNDLERLLSLLESLSVDYILNLGIARGLDYYTGTVFEFYAKDLGAQRQICGGGSYELAQLFGGERTPATGFAIGFDRVCELFSEVPKKSPVIVVVNFPGFENFAFKVASKLRSKGLKVVVDVMERSLKRQLSYANDIKASYAILIGEEEVSRGEFKVKDLATGKQFDVRAEDITTFLSELMREGE
ncbi:MAG: histidine--tRNA ligase [Archaeoglobaceae archaeon]|nr:histidine--tRNA ligase [Archaeoglobaceae archaeon]MCX7999577.1 histidine--tRNA ligase [Leptospiraceae bacterium]MDW7989879.1 histidine--tRNA ligase [Archaeoglobaceae archaeon]